MAQRAPGRRIGFDGLELRVAQALAAAGVEAHASDLIERMRWVKE
jgi:hypothetical protein